MPYLHRRVPLGINTQKDGPNINREFLLEHINSLAQLLQLRRAYIRTIRESKVQQIPLAMQILIRKRAYSTLLIHRLEREAASDFRRARATHRHAPRLLGLHSLHLALVKAQRQCTSHQCESQREP